MNKIIKENWKDFAIFPCKENSKVPDFRIAPHGFKSARFGQDVEEMAKCHYNPALALSLSKLIAFDLDYHDKNSTAEEDLKSLEDKLGELPKTLTQTTATGKGKHLIFSAKGIGQPIGKIGKNIDIKMNGYVMIPPSSINGRQYEIIDGIDENGNFIIAELPENWVNYLDKGINQELNKTQSVQAPKIYKNINIEKMFNNCNFLQYCNDNADCLSEPEWFTMISVLAQIKDSDELIHNLSEPYPKYNFDETQKKIEHARKFGYSQTCKYISTEFPEICQSCNASHIKKAEVNYGN